MRKPNIYVYFQNAVDEKGNELPDKYVIGPYSYVRTTFAYLVINEHGEDFEIGHVDELGYWVIDPAYLPEGCPIARSGDLVLTTTPGTFPQEAESTTEVNRLSIAMDRVISKLRNGDYQAAERIAKRALKDEKSEVE